MIAIAIALVAFFVLIAFVVSPTGQAPEDVVMLCVALALFAIVGTIPTIQWLQKERYRRLIDKGLGLPHHSRFDWFNKPFKQRPTRWVLGLCAIALSVTYLVFADSSSELPRSQMQQATKTSTEKTAELHLATNDPREVALKPNVIPRAEDKGTQHDRVVAAIHAWAEAWARRDVDAYLAAYSPSFRSEDGLSLEAWEVVRRKRFATVGEITVEVGDLVITPIGTAEAAAEFIQNYSAGGTKDRSRKQLMLSNTGGQWRILSEHAEPIAARKANRGPR